MHEDLSRTERVESGSNRSFGLVMSGALAIIALWPLLHGGEARVWLLLAGALFAASALLRPSLLSTPNRLWHQFGLLLHRLVSPIILGFLFFVVLLPTALVLRVLRKDLLHLRWSPDAPSYWIERNPPGPEPETMTRQF